MIPVVGYFVGRTEKAVLNVASRAQTQMGVGVQKTAEVLIGQSKLLQERKRARLSAQQSWKMVAAKKRMLAAGKFLSQMKKVKHNRESINELLAAGGEPMMETTSPPSS